MSEARLIESLHGYLSTVLTVQRSWNTSVQTTPTATLEVEARKDLSSKYTNATIVTTADASSRSNSSFQT